jgi:hypothetical protein
MPGQFLASAMRQSSKTYLILGKQDKTASGVFSKS